MYHSSDDFFPKELDDVEAHIKTLTVVSDNEDEEEEENEVDMYCVTCGHQIHTRTAIKHMEKCFNKVKFIIGVQHSYLSIHQENDNL